MTYLSPIPPCKDEHIEIYRRANDEDKNGNTFIYNFFSISIALVISIPLAFKILEELNLVNEVDSIFNIDGTTSQPASPSGGGGSSAYQLPPYSPQQPKEELASPRLWNSNHRRVRIEECNGVRLQGADFRKYPSLNQTSISGFIPAGAWVTLTGASSSADGLDWYEVVNESTVFSSTGSNTKFAIGNEDIGWIAACFVDS